VGVDNFGDVIFSRFWWLALWNSLRYSFLVMSLTFIPPIFLAILLQEIPSGKLFFRIVYYLPAVITGLVTILLWKQFYDPSENGALNALVMNIPAIGFIGLGLFLLLLGLVFAHRFLFYRMHLLMWVFILLGVLLLATCAAIPFSILFPGGLSLGQNIANLPTTLFARLPEPYRWLSDPGTAMLSCVIPMVWAGIGPGCLIYLAALKGIADDYYEAADIDGATFVDKILFIIFPSLKALIMINFIGVFIGSWYGETGNILAMTGGGANTETAGLHIWYEAFTFLKLGPATAMAWMLGFLMIGFTVQQLRILSRVEFKATGRG
jgi:multiple sugar transport system permease protein